MVNPSDLDEVSGAVQRALAMPLKERRTRWRALMNVLEANTITTWRTRFLDALKSSAQPASGLSRVAATPDLTTARV
nr:trehalose-6-phosphate synthase [Luteibacter yeojuensis]